jgi:hypothetical protein
LENLRQARSTTHWLTPETGGLDRAQQARRGGLPVSPTSARWTANSDPLAATQLLDALAEVLAEPKPPTAPPTQLLRGRPSVSDSQAEVTVSSCLGFSSPSLQQRAPAAGVARPSDDRLGGHPAD